MADGAGLLVFGAHPDDCEFSSAGLAALWTAAGGRARFVSMTNGDAGHQTLGGAHLARIRREEAREAAAILGVESIVLDNHDGTLMPSIEIRNEVIRIIREFRPDVILLPRPNDYHPDHRYTSLIVQDATYMVTVPNVCAYADRLEKDAVVAYVSDRFRRPYPFQPDIVVDIGPVVDRKVDALDRHATQMYEWLPWNRGDGVPPDGAAERLCWLRERLEPRLRRDADRFRDALVARYGPERGAAVVYAEVFEVCEYGSPLDDVMQERLFPW
jgi:N-acetylglucosamine malate deacetylase 1